jgi:glycosyltransferase involved in cell wall biosynthesis
MPDIINGAGRAFGDLGGRGLIFIQSANPCDHPTSGSGVCHRDWAKALQNLGFDVVIIQATNKYNELIGRVPYQFRNIPFDGSRNNPELKNDPSLYRDYLPAIPFNYGAFLAATRSSFQFVDHSDRQLEAHINSFAWAFRAASLVYGVPDVAWNGHAWIQNYVSLGVPTVFTVHGTGAVGEHSGGRERRLLHINKRGVNKSYRAIAISEQELQNIRNFGIPEDRSQIIYNGFDPEIFYPNRGATKNSLIAKHAETKGLPDLSGLDPDANWVVFVGRAAHFKGMDNLIEAMPLVLKEEPNTHMIVIGTGDHSKVDVNGSEPISHLSMVARLGIQDHVHFIGKLDQPEMADVVSVADAYPLPSRNEPFGLVAIEGMAVGRTPILTKSGGFRCIIECYTGTDPCLMETNDIDVARLVEAEDADDPSSRDRAIKSLAEAVVADIRERHDERSSRASKAVPFALENFRIQRVVEREMIPVIEAAKREGYRSRRWELVYNVGEHRPLRNERLDAVQKDEDVAESFAYLRSSIGDADFGAAWRQFDWSVIAYLGRAEFPYPLRLKAMPNYRRNPNAIFSELSRAAGVSTREMVRVMRAVKRTPWYELVPKEHLRGTVYEVKKVRRVTRQLPAVDEKAPVSSAVARTRVRAEPYVRGVLGRVDEVVCVGKEWVNNKLGPLTKLFTRGGVLKK